MGIVGILCPDILYIRDDITISVHPVLPNVTMKKVSNIFPLYFNVEVHTERVCGLTCTP